MFLNHRTPPAADTCTKLPLQLGFHVHQGWHVLSPSLETSHVPQTPSRRVHGGILPPAPALLLPTSRPGEDAAVGSSVPNTSCPAAREAGKPPPAWRLPVLGAAESFNWYSCPDSCPGAVLLHPNSQPHQTVSPGLWGTESSPWWPPPASVSPLQKLGSPETQNTQIHHLGQARWLCSDLAMGKPATQKLGG